MSTAPLPIASTDVETTGTNPTYHVAWEVAVILRALDGTETRRLWQIRPSSAELRVADDEALDISRFRERFAVPDGADAADMTPTLTGGNPIPLRYMDAARQMYDVLDGTVMVGSNPHFDASFLHHLFRVKRDPWHYRPVCAVTLAVARLRAQGAAWEMPFSTTDIANAIGVPRPGPDKQHTALGDATWALALYDAATAPSPALRVDPGELTPHEARLKAEAERDTALLLVAEWCTQTANSETDAHPHDLAVDLMSRLLQAGITLPEVSL